MRHLHRTTGTTGLRFAIVGIPMACIGGLLLLANGSCSGASPASAGSAARSTSSTGGEQHANEPTSPSSPSTAGSSPRSEAPGTRVRDGGLDGDVAGPDAGTAAADGGPRSDAATRADAAAEADPAAGASRVPDAQSTCNEDDDCTVTRYPGCCCQDRDSAAPNFYAISNGDLRARKEWCKSKWHRRRMGCDEATCPPPASEQPEPTARKAVCRGGECVSVPAGSSHDGD